VRHTRRVSQGENRKKRRKPKRPLPPVPKYVPYSGGGRRYWRIGGPLTKDHEAEAKAARAAKPPGRLGRLVLRILGGARRRLRTDHASRRGRSGVASGGRP
jgi:hypothetical protein